LSTTLQFTLDDIIYTKDARERMAELTPPAGGVDTDEYLDWLDTDGEEYRAILDFRMGVIGEWGEAAWDANLSFVADHYFAKYAQDKAEDIYSGADTPYWDKQKWADDERTLMSAFNVQGTEYWGDGER
jgi:hypothetical protein